jgi:hypothetical protein
MLTREQILAPRKLPTELVPTPELGEGTSLAVRRLTARELMALIEKGKAEPDLAYAHWMVATIVDDDGKPLLTEADAAAMADQDHLLVERLVDAAQRLNLAGKGQAAKNSPAIPSEGSVSA